MKRLDRKSTYGLIAFLFPAALMLLCYLKIGVYPFGDKTVYTWDLQGQYSSFMVFLHNLLTGQADGTYSLIGYLGGSIYGLAAYYLGSPFNLLMVFFDAKTMPIGIMLLLLLKTGCMGLFLFLYLYQKKQSFAAVLSGTAYALSAYAIVYGSNIMWLDAMVFLPLVIWGLEKLIRDGKCRLYILSLGLAVISCYFIAYMLCIFVVLYFAGYLLFMESKKGGFREKLRITGRFALSSLCGGALAAFLLLPAVLELQAGIAKNNVKREAIKNGARLFYYRSILPFSMSCSYDDSQRWDAMGTFPLLYCSVLAVFGLLLFFMAKKISRRRKLFQIFLMAALLVSCNHMNLFFIWHGFYTPFGAPWRFMFLWGFVALTASCEGIACFVEEKDWKRDGIAIVGIVLYLFWIFWRFEPYRKITIFNGVILFGEITGLFFWKYAKRYKNRAGVVICALVMGAELFCNAIYTWDQGFSFESYADYQNDIDTMEEALIREDGLYRSEIAGVAKRNRNDGYLWNINTIESYASTAKAATQKIGDCFDLGALAVIGSYNLDAPLLTKDIIGMKYLYGDDTTPHAGFEKIKTSESGISVYKNENALPFGFLVNDTALDILPGDESKTAAAYQNAFFHALGGSVGWAEGLDVCREMEQKDVSDASDAAYAENAELIQKAVSQTAACTLETINKGSSDITSRIKNDLGKAAYVCYSVPYENGWTAEVDGVKTEPAAGMGGLLLVPVEEGEHEVRILYHAPGSRLGGLISVFCLIAVLSGTFLKRFKMNKFFHSPHTNPDIF